MDSAAAFKKARAEGKNLVEVFEELANKALNGDRSRLGELIDDMEFKRGVQALMSYRGDWQKLSQTLQDTSGGTVLRDLVQVTRPPREGAGRGRTATGAAPTGNPAAAVSAFVAAAHDRHGRRRARPPREDTGRSRTATGAPPHGKHRFRLHGEPCCRRNDRSTSAAGRSPSR